MAFTLPYTVQFMLLLCFAFQLTSAVTDQSPCSNNTNMRDFKLCPNLTLVDFSAYAIRTQSGMSLTNWKVKVDFDGAGPSFSKTVCYNDFGLCEECNIANYSNNSSPLTQTCKQNNCVCSVKGTSSQFLTSIGGAFSTGLVPGQVPVSLDLDSGDYNSYIGVDDPFGFVQGTLDTSNSKRTTPVIYVTFEQPWVKVTIPTGEKFIVWVSILTASDMVNCTASCTITINEAWMITDELLKVFVTWESQEIFNGNFPIKPATFCPIPTNPFSTVWSISWNCMTVAGKFLLVGGYISFAVAVLTIIVGLFQFGKFLFLLRVQEVNVTLNQPLGNDVAIELESPIEKDEGMDHVKRMLSRNVGFRANNLFILFMFFAVINAQVPVHNACMNTITSISNVSSCTVVNNIKTCTFDLNAVLTLQDIGATSCLSFLDVEGNVIDTIRIKYEQSLLQVVLKKEYYTSAWEPMAASLRICPGSAATQLVSPLVNVGSVISPGEACGLWNNLTGNCDDSYYYVGYLPDCIVNPTTTCTSLINCLPGEYLCGLTTNKGCGSFDFGDAYVFGRYAYLPVGAVFKVYSIDYAYLQPRLKITYQESDNEFDVRFTDSTVEFITPSGSINIEIIGELFREMTNFGNKKIIIGKDEDDTEIAYYGSACDANVPISGAIGDIQASLDTQLHAKDPTTKQFIFPENSVNFIIKDGAMDFKFPRSGMKANKNYLTQLPAVINGEEWTVKEDVLLINAINSGALQVKLTAGASFPTFTMQQRINYVCPNILNNNEALHLVGCSNCIQGIVANVTVVSDCEDGITSVKVECSAGTLTLLTMSCNLYTDPTQCLIRMIPHSKSLICEIRITSGEKSDSIQFTALAPELETITNITGDNIIIEEPDHVDIHDDKEMNGFLDWFNSLDGWKTYVKWFVISLICMIVLGIVLGFLIKLKTLFN